MMKAKMAKTLAAAMAFTTIAGAGSVSAFAKDKSVVTLLSWYTEDQMKPLAEGFEAANPDYELEVQYVPPTDQYIEKLTLLMNGNEPTDLFFMCPEVREDVVATDFAVDLSDLPIMDRLSEGAKSCLGVGDAVYGVSLDSWIAFMFYNKDIFEEAGIKETPKTWDELVEDMGKIQDAGYSPYAIDMDNVGRLAFGLFSADEVSKDMHVEDAISDGSKKFSELYKDTMNRWADDVVAPGYLGQESLSLTSNQVNEMFATGQIGMMIGGTWTIPSINEINPDLNWGGFAFPGTDGGQMLQGAANVGIGIARKADNMEGAKAFMDYLTSDDGIQAWSGAFGNFMNPSGVDYEVDSHLEEFKQYVADGKLYWQTVEWPNSNIMNTVYVPYCQNILAGVNTVDEMLQAMDDKFAEYAGK